MSDDTRGFEVQLAIYRAVRSHRIALEAKNSGARYLTPFARGIVLTQMLGKVCEIGLADALPEAGFRSYYALANELNVNAKALLRLARTLAGFGVFSVDLDGQISHNALSKFLRTECSQSTHCSFRPWFSPNASPGWKNLWRSLKIGEDTLEDAHRRQFFNCTHGKLDDEKAYQHHIVGESPREHEAIAHALELPGNEMVMDIGGGGDLFILSWVLNSWSDTKLREILASCHRAMSSTSRLVFVERLLDEDSKPSPPLNLLLDVNNLVLPESGEGTQFKLDILLKSSGFAPLKLVRENQSFAIFATKAL